MTAAAVGAYALNRSTRPTPPPSATESTTVTFEITVNPDVDAAITIAGKPVVGRPAKAVIARGDDAIIVRAEADGFEASELKVAPDRDRALLIPLTKLAPKAETKVVAADAAAPAPSASATKPTPGPIPRRRDKSGIITDNPF